MNMKMINYSVLVLLTVAASQVFAQDEGTQTHQTCLERDDLQNKPPEAGPNYTARSEVWRARIADLTTACNAATQQANTAASNQPDARISSAMANGTQSQKCKASLHEWNNKMSEVEREKVPVNQKDQLRICEQLKKLSEQGMSDKEPLEDISVKESVIVSTDGQIKCKAYATYTMDYEPCKSAVTLYDAVLMAEKAMDMQQKVRTDLKGANLNKEAQKKAAEGDVQGAALDGQMSMQKHMEGINKEKVLTYIAATGALMKAWWSIPGEKQVAEKCMSIPTSINTQTRVGDLCEKTSKTSGILANKEAKAALQIANVAFASKAMAAQLALKQNQNNQQTIAKVKKPFETETEDVMFERCQFNPADPACIEAGNRVRGGGVNFGSGDFDLGGGGSNNAFDLSPEGAAFGEAGAESTLDDKNEVASLNNPFADAAKDAKGILNPAGAAQTQATGGAAGGGGGGGGGGTGGGGGASLGSDLSGESKDANKEAQIKAGKVSGIYGATGGGGYKGVGKSKGDKNPFASLFDKKSEGGVVEDRSLASSDIDGKSSGLFQKISKRYNKIHSDKRIEANNLE